MCVDGTQIFFASSQPEKRPAGKRKLKGLGSKSYAPVTQTIGFLSGHGLTEDIDIAKLAEGYIYEGFDRVTVCARNAEVEARIAKKKKYR